MKDLLLTTKEELNNNIIVVIDYLFNNYKPSKDNNIKDLKHFNEVIKDGLTEMKKGLNLAITYAIGNQAKSKSFKRALSENLLINEIATINYHIIIKSLDLKDMTKSILVDMLCLLGYKKGFKPCTNQGKVLTKEFAFIASCFGIKCQNISDNPKAPKYDIIDVPTIEGVKNTQLKVEFTAPAKKEKAKKPSQKELVSQLLEKSKDLTKALLISELKKIFNI